MNEKEVSWREAWNTIVGGMPFGCEKSILAKDAIRAYEQAESLTEKKVLRKKARSKKLKQ